MFVATELAKEHLVKTCQLTVDNVSAGEQCSLVLELCHTCQSLEGLRQLTSRCSLVSGLLSQDFIKSLLTSARQLPVSELYKVSLSIVPNRRLNHNSPLYNPHYEIPKPVMPCWYTDRNRG